ncbi:hypothetical protein LXL04_032560 [Taraxacum kok-saghyz]
MHLNATFKEEVLVRFADSRSFEEINQIDDLDRSTPIRHALVSDVEWCGSRSFDHIVEDGSSSCAKEMSLAIEPYINHLDFEANFGKKCWDLLRTHIFPRTRELPNFLYLPKRYSFQKTDFETLQNVHNDCNSLKKNSEKRYLFLTFAYVQLFLFFLHICKLFYTYFFSKFCFIEAFIAQKPWTYNGLNSPTPIAVPPFTTLS